MPSYGIKILQKAADRRTEEEVQLIRQMMLSLTEFRKYNQQLQLCMSRIVRYFKYVNDCYLVTLHRQVMNDLW